MVYSAVGGGFHLVSLLLLEESIGGVLVRVRCLGVGEGIELGL